MINNSKALLLAFLVCGCRPAGTEANTYGGVIEFEETPLAFEVPGRVALVSVKRGDVVDENSLIATMSDSVESTLVKAREAERAAATAQSELVAAGARPAQIRALRSAVRASEADLAQRTRELEREKQLFASNVSTKEIVDQRETAVLLSQAALDQRKFELQNLELGSRKQEIESAKQKTEAAGHTATAEKLRLDKYELRSPMRGEVLDVHVDPGEVVAAATPVVTLARLDEEYIEVFVPQGSLAGIRVGTAAEVFVDGLAHGLRAKVTHVSRATEFTPRYIFSPDERARLVVRVRLAIEDPRKELHAGVPARAKFEGSAP